MQKENFLLFAFRWTGRQEDKKCRTLYQSIYTFLHENVNFFILRYQSRHMCVSMVNTTLHARHRSFKQIQTDSNLRPGVLTRSTLGFIWLATTSLTQHFLRTIRKIVAYSKLTGQKTIVIQFLMFQYKS